MRYLEAGITVLLIGVALLFVGCTRWEAPVGNDERVESDSDGHSHASDHHHHSKQSPDPLYGGQVVAIGHTHRGSDHTHYYVEVMPVVDDRLTFHVLSVNTKNKADCVVRSAVVRMTVTLHLDVLTFLARTSRTSSSFWAGTHPRGRGNEG